MQPASRSRWRSSSIDVYKRQAQANETHCKELEDYAFGIGLVFQIVDDVLDVTSTARMRLPPPSRL